jgi:hypothetical protein
MNDIVVKWAIQTFPESIDTRLGLVINIAAHIEQFSLYFGQNIGRFAFRVLMALVLGSLSDNCIG